MPEDRLHETINGLQLISISSARLSPTEKNSLTLKVMLKNNVISSLTLDILQEVRA